MATGFGSRWPFPREKIGGKDEKKMKEIKENVYNLE